MKNWYTRYRDGEYLTCNLTSPDSYDLKCREVICICNGSACSCESCKDNRIHNKPIYSPTLNRQEWEF